MQDSQGLAVAAKRVGLVSDWTQAEAPEYV